MTAASEAASFLLKIGDTEVHLSGSESFLEKQIASTLEFLSRRPASSGPARTSPDPKAEAKSPDDKIELGMNTIGAKLGVKSGPDLILAAAISLHCKGKTTYSRKELVEETRLASNYFKQTVVKNFSSSLKTLTGQQKLLEQGADAYALPAGVLQELQAKLA